MRIDIITIFGEYFTALHASLIGKAVQRGDITLGVHDLRAGPPTCTAPLMTRRSAAGPAW